jgi:hypothetical protein
LPEALARLRPVGKQSPPDKNWVVGGVVFTTLLIIHGLLAVALLGSITHQTAAAVWPATSKASFISAFRGVAGTRYTVANIVLYVVIVILGAVIYPTYRLAVRPYLESAQLFTINGTFELKEQFVTIGLGVLPFYWWIWRGPLDTKLAIARAAITALLCFIVWYSFLVGHVVMNVRGLFGR